MKKLRLWTTATISCAHLLRLRGLRTPSACPTPLGTWDDVGCVPPQCNSEFSHCVRFCNRKERAETPIKYTLHCRSYSLYCQFEPVTYRLDLAVLTSKRIFTLFKSKKFIWTSIHWTLRASQSMFLVVATFHEITGQMFHTSLLNSNPLLTKNWGQ